MTDVCLWDLFWEKRYEWIEMKVVETEDTNHER